MGWGGDFDARLRGRALAGSALRGGASIDSGASLARREADAAWHLQVNIGGDHLRYEDDAAAAGDDEVDVLSQIPWREI